MDLMDMKKSISDMTDEEILSMILETRQARQVLRSEEATKSKGQTTKKESARQKTKELVAGVSQEQARALLKSLGLG